jgi:hypothetical protein
VALLRAAVLALLAAGCDGSGDLGTVDIQIIDGEVECDNGVCTDPYGDPVDPERVRTWLFASTQTSRTSPDGLFLYFELARDDGATATVEIDVPTRSVGAVEELPVVSYVENDASGQTVFSAASVRGRVEVAADPIGERCACADGRLELGLSDPGEDGVSGTGDDRARRLTRGLYGWETTFCIPAQQMELPEREVEVEVIERCPRPPTEPGSGEPSRPIRVDADPGCGETTPGGSGEGCESSSSADSGCESDSSSSCEGDGGGDGGGVSAGCEGDSSSGGCEGDTGGEGCSGDSGGGSCSGDTGGSSCSGSGSGCSGSGCPGDVATAAPLAGVPRACTGRGPRGRGNPLGGRAQLFTLLGLVLLYQVLHARRLARR